MTTETTYREFTVGAYADDGGQIGAEFGTEYLSAIAYLESLTFLRHIASATLFGWDDDGPSELQGWSRNERGRNPVSRWMN